MIEIDPQDRLLHFTAKKGRAGTVIALTLAAIAIFGAGIFYWIFVSQTFADVYKQLNIAPLPITVEFRPKIYSRLDQLKREPCYSEAIVELSDELLDVGYPRESAAIVLAFANRCGSAENTSLLSRAYIGLTEVSDFSGALQIANQLVDLHPESATFRYSRGATFEQLKRFSDALSDYMTSLQLVGNLSEIAVDNFYDISRMYAASGRYCDAISPIETFISFNPVKNRTPQLTKIIAEYANKGACETKYARGSSRVQLLGAPNGYILSVIVNGVVGNFLLDTGATYVAVTPDFSQRAKVNIEAADRLPIKTVGGNTLADLGYANSVSVGNAEAQGVAVAVVRGSSDPFGHGLDGLLGMSFLARFNVRLSQNGIELKAIPLQ
jgi:clan AA aspartic protease (TIGR02281 family)